MTLGTQVASLFGVLALDDSDFQRGLKDADKGMSSLSDNVKDFGGKLQSIGGQMTAFGAPFLGIAALGQHAFDEIDDAVDQLGAVLKSTGGAAGVTEVGAKRLATELQNLSGITRAQILTGENMLLTFTNIGGQVFPRATKAALDLSVAMKQDMKSSAIQLGKALNNPIEGITALTRVGVTFTDSQKEMIETMVKAGDIAGAQGIILTEIEKEFGGSAAAAADPIDHLGTLLNDLAIDIGVSLQPVLEAVIPIISDVVKGISMFLTTMTDNGDNTVGIILAIGAGLAILGPVLAIVGTGLTAIGGLLAVVFSPIGLIIGAIVALFVAIQSNFLGIRDFLQPVIDSISNFFAHFSDNVKLYGSLFQLYFDYYITSNLRKIWEVVGPALGKLMAWFVSDGLPAIQQAALFLWNNVLTPVVNFIAGIWDFVKANLGLFAEWFTTGGLQRVAEGLNKFKTNAIDPFIKAVLFIWDQAKPGLELLKAGFEAAFNWIKNNVIQPVITLVNGILNQLNLISGNSNIQGSVVGSELGNALGIGANSAAITSVGGFGGSVNSPNVTSSGGFGGVVPIPAGTPGGVSPIPIQGARSMSGPTDNSMSIGEIHIHANSEAEGQSGMRGALSAARAKGY